VKADGHVVPGFDVLENFFDLIGGLQISGGPGGGGEQIDRRAVQKKAPGLGPEQRDDVVAVAALAQAAAGGLD